MSIENPDADRREQLRSANYEEVEDDEVEELDGAELPLDADPSDVADQHRVVPFDDDRPDEWL